MIMLAGNGQPDNGAPPGWVKMMTYGIVTILGILLLSLLAAGVVWIWKLVLA